MSKRGAESSPHSQLTTKIRKSQSGGSKMETFFLVSQIIFDILVIIYIVNEKRNK
nr:MAG TPA: hypothetical protein [Caudoviricetes sp.]